MFTDGRRWLGITGMTGSNRTAPPIEAAIGHFAPVAAEVARGAEALIESITEAIREEIPSCRMVPNAVLRDAVSAQVRRGLESSLRDAAPSPSDLEEAAVIAREATEFGVPIEDQLQAIRVGVRLYWAECVQAAATHDLDPTTLICASEPIWRWADGIGLAFARGHREASLEEAEHLERERSAFLIGLLHGSLAGPDLLTGAAVHRLALDVEYLPLRARAIGSASRPFLCERAIRHAFGPAEGVMFCPHDGELIGIVPRRPAIDEPGVIIGLGQPTPVERIAPSYREAVRALEVASRFGLRGTFDLADLSLRTPVATDTMLGERLVARYLEPFRDGSHAGAQLERTLRAYLEAGLCGEAAARVLGVHPNTVRNRLRRIEGLIDLRLRDPAQLAELWWAVQYDRIAGEAERDL
jgi:hypothetical protein